MAIAATTSGAGGALASGGCSKSGAVALTVVLPPFSPYSPDDTPPDCDRPKTDGVEESRQALDSVPATGVPSLRGAHAEPSPAADPRPRVRRERRHAARRVRRRRDPRLLQRARRGDHGRARDGARRAAGGGVAVARQRRAPRRLADHK